MAEPPIKATLESAEFTTDPTPEVRERLAKCLRSDPDHIMPEYRGGKEKKDVVKAIQDALTKINATLPPESKLPPITDAAGVYGRSTADAVLKYKAMNAIQRTGQPLDDIVGRMTISRLDDELKNLRIRPPTPPPPPPPGPTPPDPVTRPFAFCRQNAKIFIDGTDAVKRTVPLNPVVYVNDTLATFDTICANPLGRKLVVSVHENLVVKPYLETDVNARTDGRVAFIRGWHLEFSPDIFATTTGQPGARADEVLLHELIHFWEHSFHEYVDAPDGSLLFDHADFLTVNGTNVYSTSISRSPRKDHRGFVLMPDRYATDAREHMILYRENYEKGFDNNRELFGFFKNQTASWNPFASFTRDVTKTVFIVEVATENWKWRFDLFSDSTARWIDTRNPGQFGIGAWRQDGGTIVIDWKGGGFDRFPEAGPGQFVTGQNKTGGVVRDSLVVKQ